MSARFSALSRLLAGAGLSAVAEKVAATPPAATVTLADAGAQVIDEDGKPLVLESDATAAIQAAHAAGRAEGVAAEKTRTAQVLGSEPARANMAAAAFLLEETDTPAATIIEKLPAMGVPAPAPKAEQEAPAAPALTVDLAETPKVVVGAKEGDDDPDHKSLWDDVLGKQAAASPFAPAAITQGSALVPAGH